MNHINGLVSYLRGDPAVASRVSSRVFGPDGIPESLNATMPRQAIVLSPAGGFGAIGNAYQEYGDKRVDVLCFGASQAESFALFLDARAALKRLRRKTLAVSASEEILIHWARISADGVTALEPEHGWPATLSSWQVLASEVAIPT